MGYNCIIVETHEKVGLVRLNRPKQLNALNDELMNELGDALTAFETDDKIGAIVVTGSDKAFAAGADVAEMKDNSFAHAYNTNFVTRNWDAFPGAASPSLPRWRAMRWAGAAKSLWRATSSSRPTMPYSANPR